MQEIPESVQATVNSIDRELGKLLQNNVRTFDGIGETQ